MIYFIQQGESGPIKIGFTRSKRLLKRRLYSLQGSTPEKLHLRCSFNGTRINEKSLHYKFRYLRIKGEWFRPNKILLNFITEMYYRAIIYKQHSLFFPQTIDNSSYFGLPDNIKTVLQTTGNNKARAARILRISRTNLYLKIKNATSESNISYF